MPKGNAKGALSSGKPTTGTTSGQLRTSRSETKNVNKMGVNGVYGANPSPSFNSYKQDTSPSTIPTKFGETGIGTAMRQVNQMRGPNAERMRVREQLTTSTIKTSQNKLRGSRS
jgi:hypothetical protein